MRRVIGGDWDEVLYEPEDGDEGYRSVTIFIDGEEVFEEYIQGEFGWDDSIYEEIAWEMYRDSPEVYDELMARELNGTYEVTYRVDEWYDSDE